MSSFVRVYNVRALLWLKDALAYLKQTLKAHPTQKSKEPLRFGILGAANIAPAAIIQPATSHPDVVIAAVAARDETKARTFARKHAIQKVYFGKDGYQSQSGRETIPQAITDP